MSLLSTYERIIREAGGPENLADMLICESPEFFGFGEFNSAKRRLIKKKLYCVSPLKALSFVKNKPSTKRSFARKAARIGVRYWTHEDEQYLRDNISDMSYDELAFQMDRTIEAIYSKCAVLGISKHRRIA